MKVSDLVIGNMYLAAQGDMSDTVVYLGIITNDPFKGRHDFDGTNTVGVICDDAQVEEYLTPVVS